MNKGSEPLTMKSEKMAEINGIALFESEILQDFFRNFVENVHDIRMVDSLWDN